MGLDICKLFLLEEKEDEGEVEGKGKSNFESFHVLNTGKHPLLTAEFRVKTQPLSQLSFLGEHQECGYSFLSLTCEAPLHALTSPPPPMIF